MAETGYLVRIAAADLAAAGLFAAALVEGRGAWRRVDEPAAVPGGIAFLGAELDSRRVSAGALFVALAGERADGRDFAPQALRGGAVVLTRPWPAADVDPLLRARPPAGAAVLLSPEPRTALALLGRRWRERLPVRVAAITGSNGKTTTKDLLAAAFAAAGPMHATSGNLNNELGLPVTLLGLRAEHRLAAIELGASAEGEIARLAALAGPEVGVITNAAEAHLAEFGSLAGVIRGKGELLDALPPGGVAVLNADSPGFADWRARARCRVVSFGAAAGEHRWSWRAEAARGGGVVRLDGGDWSVPVPGRHNGANLVAAVLAARACGLDDGTIRRGLAAFRPSAHRSRILRRGGILLFDDCYNANPASMLSAVAALVEQPGADRTLAVLGLMAELGPDSAAIHRRTGEEIRERGLDILLAVGEDAWPMADGFAAGGGEAHRLADRDAAVAWLAENLRAGDRLLVKGSRAAGMEEVLERLLPRWPADGETEI